jgi:tetratricopeptide (TPR) repeat protein
MRLLPVIAIALAFPTTAWADPVAAQRAQELYERAEVHFNVGEFRRALELYRAAYKLQPLIGLIVDLGRCHQQLGEYDRALFQYRTYLHQLPDAPNRAEVERLIAECEAAKRAGAGGKVPFYVYKEPEPGGAGRRRVHRGWFWSGAVLGGALLATGVVTGALNLSMSAEYKDPTTTIARRRELKDAGEPLGAVSVATLAAGGAVAVATVLLYFYTDFGGSRDGPGVAFSPVPRGATMVVGGSF